MTEKVKIPQNVADAIEKFRNAEYSNYGIVTNLDNSEIAAGKGLSKELKTLRDWIYDKPYDNPDNFLDVLVNDYEIEPEYKEGDWVLWGYENTKEIIRIDSFTEDRTVAVCDGVSYNAKYIKRHVTPEEIKAEKEHQLWKKHDREVGEFKDNDIGLGEQGEVFHTAHSIESAYNGGDLIGLWPAESFISFEEGDSND